MSKKFKGRTCVYCAELGAASTGDHIFARQFFPESRRRNLPKVAACAPCNAEKSKLEHYLTAVLPFGARHTDSSVMLERHVPGRLARNHKLHQDLIEGSGPVVVIEAGERAEQLAIPFDAQKLEALFSFVARGLASFHWNQIIPPSHRLESIMLNPVYEPIMRDLFLKSARRRVAGSVGDAAFRYEGAQAIDDPAMMIWRFQAYGGVVLSGDPHVPEAGAYTVWALSTSRELNALRDL